MESLKLIYFSFSLTLACDISFSPNYFNSCSLTLVNPFSGFVIASENCGLEIDKGAFYEQPFIFYDDAVDTMKYMLIMVDNDNPLAFDGNVYLHWLITDIDGNALKYGLIDSGNIVAGKSSSLKLIMYKG